MSLEPTKVELDRFGTGGNQTVGGPREHAVDGGAGPIREPVERADLVLKDIKIDHDLQARVKLDSSVVADYAERLAAGDRFPPRRVFKDSDDYWLSRGFHRQQAAVQAGLTSFPCEILRGTKSHAQLDACADNKSHGLRRSNEDKRKAVELCLMNPLAAGWNNQRVADHVGVSESFVRKTRHDLEEDGRISVSFETKLGADGKSYPTRKWRTKNDEPTPEDPAPSNVPDNTGPAPVQCRDDAMPPAAWPCAVYPEKVPLTLAQWTVDRRREHFTRWWDQLATYTVLVSTAGWGPSRIADFAGMSAEEDVEPILNPRVVLRASDEFTFVSQKPELLARVYEQTVLGFVDGWLHSAYASAAGVAACEGFPEVEEELTRQAEDHWCKYQALPFWVCNADAYHDESVNLWMCAWYDVRLATGIEKDTERIRRTRQPLQANYEYSSRWAEITKCEAATGGEPVS